MAEVEPRLVGMEACGSAHDWARRFGAMGHEMRLTPPSYVNPYGAPRRRGLPVEEGSTQSAVD